MLLYRIDPVDSFENLRERIDGLLNSRRAGTRERHQLQLEFPSPLTHHREIFYPSKSITHFLSFLSDALPDGDVYLFGGVIRDMALLGRRGFSSDIDLVVEGDWRSCESYLHSLGARKNKFGGYRLTVAGWPVDIWNAAETWAIRQGFVPYTSIASLTETTVLNWDAILMNWRTKTFVCRPNYLDALRARLLDVVLQQNPNPLGMAVRVFRHFCLKDARSVTSSAAQYLAACTKTYSFDVIRQAEIQSYGHTVIDLPVFTFFKHLAAHRDLNLIDGFDIATVLAQKELGL